MSASDDASGVGQRVALGAYALAIGALAWAFLGKFPVPEFLPKLAAVLSALWYAHALHAAGRFTRTAISRSTTRRGLWENRLTNVSVGFGLVAFAVVILGWAVPGNLRLKVQFIFGLLIAASLADLLSRWDRRHAGERTAVKWDIPVWVAAVPAAGAVASFLTSFTPITHYDSLVYHLALPAIYLREGAIGAVPFNLYSFFPAAAEMNFLVILAALPAPEYTINILGWLLALALGAAVAEWSREIGGIEQSWVSLILWWTAPLVLLLSQGAYVDLPLAGATFLAVRWYALGRKSGDRDALMMSGLMAGLAFSIKYTGGLTALLLSIDLAVSCARRKLSWSAFLPFGVAAIVFPAPWLIKNLMTAGNPVFPFFYKQLGGNVGWTSATADGYFKVLTEYGAKSNALVDLLAGLWRPSDAGARGGFDVLGDFGWPVILFGAPLAYVLRRSDRDVRFLSLYGLAHLLGWYFSKPVLRFLIGVFPIGVVLASAGLQTLLFKRGRLARAATIALTLPWLISNVFIYGLIADELKLFTVPFGEATGRQFLQQRLAFYPTFESVNAGLGRDAKVLVIGEQRTYHLTVPFISSNLFAPSPIGDLAGRAAGIGEIGADLRRRGVTAVIMNEGEIQRLGGLRRFGFSEAGERMLREFLAQGTTIVSQDRGVFLHKINAG